MQNMNAIAVLRDLRASGMPEAQAEVIANVLGGQAANQAATKRDLETGFATHKRDIDARFDRLETSLDLRFAQIETKLDLTVAKVELSNQTLYDKLLKASMFVSLGFIGVLVTALNLLVTGRIKLG